MIPSVMSTGASVALRRGIGIIALLAGLGSFGRGFPAEYRAGTARAKVTPEKLGWVGGYGHRTKPAEGVAADLWARALALEDKAGRRRVMVNADIHIFTRTLHRQIAAAARKRFGVEERDLMLIATHTHSGPALPEGFDPIISWGLDEAEMRTLWSTADRIRDRIVEAIGRALDDLKPARLAFGRGEARFGVNRRVLQADGNWDFGANPGGITDPDVPILWVETPEGKSRAVVFTYACHSTTIRRGHEGFYRYHPDYAGVAAEEIERKLGGATAIYATGCAGEIDPQPQGGVEQAEAHGRSLASVVLEAGEKAVRRAVGGPMRSSYREIQLALSPVPSREKYVELSASPVSYRQRHARMMLAQMDAGKLPKEMPLPIQIWRFGDDLTLVALGGEVCVDYALRLKRELGAERTWAVAYANEVPAYIPSERILKEGGYEAGWDLDQGPGVPGATSNILFYGWAAPLAPGVEDRVFRAVDSLLKE
jgi:hypothetical protein